jgi:hypothetical protein
VCTVRIRKEIILLYGPLYRSFRLQTGCLCRCLLRLDRLLVLRFGVILGRRIEDIDTVESWSKDAGRIDQAPSLVIHERPNQQVQVRKVHVRFHELQVRDCRNKHNVLESAL